MELDPRVVKVGIEINGKLKVYEDLAIEATGTKFANSIQNECEIKITNLDKATRDYILTETSPFTLNRTPKLVTLDAGRVSYGTTRIFTGNVTTTGQPAKVKKSGSPKQKEDTGGVGSVGGNVSQPPDIMVVLKCLTGNYQKGNIIARNQKSLSPLSIIAKQVSEDLNLVLDFQATDRQIGNYSFSGAALKQVNKLAEMGRVDAYVDDGVLVLKDFNKALRNKIKILNLETGLIGIPEITEQGIKVKFLLDNQTTLGGLLRVQSKIYPAVNGDYTIYKLGFEIANRDTPFYWVAEAKR